MNNIEDMYHYINIDKENGSSYIYVSISSELLNLQTIGNYNKETADKYKIKNKYVCRD